MRTSALVSGLGAAALLRALRDYAGRAFTIRSLARTAGVPPSTARKWVRRAEAAGVVETTPVGRAHVVALRKTPYARRVLSVAFLPSPQRAAVDKIRRVLAPDRRVREAFLFGSVARGEERTESDVDVALWVRRGFPAETVMKLFIEKHGVKLIPLLFFSEKPFRSFLSSKIVERLK